MIPLLFHRFTFQDHKNKQKVPNLSLFGRNSVLFWSEWRDLNSRPLDPQSSALPTALHPDIYLLLSLVVSFYILAWTKKKINPFF